MEALKRFIQNDYFILISLYTMAYGLMIVNSGIYWDEWAIYNQDINDLHIFSKEIGDIWYQYIQNNVLTLNYSFIILRLIIFTCYLFSALFVYKILKKVVKIYHSQVLLLTLIFALIPLNNARLSIVVVKYAICHLAFFIGFWYFIKFVDNQKITYRIISLFSFFLSFDTSSFLVFYLIPLIFFYYKSKTKIVSFYSFMYTVIKYFDFFIIPLFFFSIKLLFFKPYGLYEGYNSISFYNIIISPLSLLGTFYSSFILPMIEVLNSSWIILPISLLVYIFFKDRKDDSLKISINVLIFGVLFFFLAVFPYHVVGRNGLDFGLEWNSRDQMLIPLGASLILFYILSIIFTHFEIQLKFRNLIYSLIIGSFVTANIINCLQFQRDWYKQLSIIENFKSSDVLKNNNCFLFIDQTKNLNAINRSYRFYEYTGLMKYAFGNTKRFGIERNEFLLTNDMSIYLKYSSYRHYNFDEFIFTRPEYIVTIQYGSNSISLGRTLYLILLKPINSNRFKENIKSIINLNYEKLQVIPS